MLVLNISNTDSTAIADLLLRVKKRTVGLKNVMTLILIQEFCCLLVFCVH